MSGRVGWLGERPVHREDEDSAAVAGPRYEVLRVEMVRESAAENPGYGRLALSMRFRYPAVVVERSAPYTRKAMLFLRRHEDVWLVQQGLAGWRPVSTGVVRPEDVGEGGGVGELLRLARLTYEEYAAAPRALSERRAESAFHSMLLAGEVYAIEVGSAGLRRVLERLLRRGVVPIDYSRSQVIVLRARTYRGGRVAWYLSLFDLDPLEVVEEVAGELGLEVVGPSAELRFEERDVGWGLAVVGRR